jgi:hypothetical protein
VALTDAERAILFLYNQQVPTELNGDQLRQFLTEADALSVEATTYVEAATLLTGLDMDARRDRFVAALGYVLAHRCLPATPAGSDALQAVGATLIGHFSDVADPVAGEADLRDAIGRLDGMATVDTDALDDLAAAFEDVLEWTDNGDGTYAFAGVASEMAQMLVEIAQLAGRCTAQTGRIQLDGKDVEVTVLQGETCSSVAFDRAKAGVDPRNWPAYNPALFQRVDVISGTPTATGSWAGIVQERVGALSGPVVTNLNVTYTERPGLAVTAYDLTPASVPGLPSDDGKVIVDHGMVALHDEGDHVRFRCVKVVAFAASEPPIAPPTEWLCPIWLLQVLLAGWWSWL